MNEKFKISPFFSSKAFGKPSFIGTPYTENSTELQLLQELDEYGWVIAEDGCFESVNIYSCNTFTEARNAFRSASQAAQGYQLETPPFSTIDLEFFFQFYGGSLKPELHFQPELQSVTIKLPKDTPERIVNLTQTAEEPEQSPTLDFDEAINKIRNAQDEEDHSTIAYFCNELIAHSTERLCYVYIAKATMFHQRARKIKSSSNELDQYIGTYYGTFSVVNFLEALRPQNAQSENPEDPAYILAFSAAEGALENMLNSQSALLDKNLLHSALAAYAEAGKTLLHRTELYRLLKIFIYPKNTNIQSRLKFLEARVKKVHCAYQALEERQYQACIDIFSELTLNLHEESTSEKVEYYTTTAYAHTKLGNYEIAKETHEKAMQLAPDPIGSLLLEATITYHQRQYEEALNLYQEVISLIINPAISLNDSSNVSDPLAVKRYINAAYGSGKCYAALNQHQNAVKSFFRIIRLLQETETKEPETVLFFRLLHSYNCLLAEGNESLLEADDYLTNEVTPSVVRNIFNDIPTLLTKAFQIFLNIEANRKFYHELVLFFIVQKDPEKLHFLCDEIDQRNIMLNLETYLPLLAVLIEFAPTQFQTKKDKNLISNLCDTALTQYPENITLYELAAQLLFLIGKQHNIVKRFKQLMDSNLNLFLQISIPNAPQLCYELAEYLFSQNLPEAAFDYYHTAISHGIKNKQKNKRLLLCCQKIISLSKSLNKSKTDIEASVCNKIMQQATTDEFYKQIQPALYDDLVFFLTEQDNSEKLYQFCEKAVENKEILSLESYNSLISSLLKFAPTHFQKKGTNLFSNICNTALEYYPDDAMLYQKAIELLLAAGKFDEAAQKLKALIDLNLEFYLQLSIPNSASLHYTLAEYLFEQNHHDVAFAHYHLAISQGIKNRKNKKKCSHCCIQLVSLAIELNKGKEDIEDNVLNKVIQLATNENDPLYDHLQSLLTNLNEQIILESEDLLFQILIGMLNTFSEKFLHKGKNFDQLNALYQTLTKHAQDLTELEQYQTIISPHTLKEYPSLPNDPVGANDSNKETSITINESKIYDYICQKALGKLSLYGTVYTEDSPELKLLKELNDIGWKISTNEAGIEIYQSPCPYLSLESFYTAKTEFLKACEKNQGYQIETPPFSSAEILFLLQAYCKELEPGITRDSFQIYFPRQLIDAWIINQTNSPDRSQPSFQEKFENIFSARQNNKTLLSIHFCNELIQEATGLQDLSKVYHIRALELGTLSSRFSTPQEEIYYLIWSLIDLLEALKFGYHSGNEKHIQFLSNNVLPLLEDVSSTKLNRELAQPLLVNYVEEAETFSDRFELYYWLYTVLYPDNEPVQRRYDALLKRSEKIEKAYTAYDQKDYSACIKLFSELLKETKEEGPSKIIQIYEKVADAHLKLENYEEALEICEKIEQLSTHAVKLLILKGKIAYHQNCYEEALEFYQQVNALKNTSTYPTGETDYFLDAAHYTVKCHLALVQHHQAIQSFIFFCDALKEAQQFNNKTTTIIKILHSHNYLLSNEGYSPLTQYDEFFNRLIPDAINHIFENANTLLTKTFESLPSTELTQTFYSRLTQFFLEKNDTEKFNTLCCQLSEHNTILDLSTYYALVPTLSSLLEPKLGKTQRRKRNEHINHILDTALSTYSNNLELYLAATTFLFKAEKIEYLTNLFKHLIDNNRKLYFQILIPQSKHSVQFHYELAEQCFPDESAAEIAYTHYQKAILQGIKNTKTSKRLYNACIKLIHFSQKLNKGEEDTSVLQKILQQINNDPLFCTENQQLSYDEIMAFSLKQNNLEHLCSLYDVIRKHEIQLTLETYISILSSLTISVPQQKNYKSFALDICDLALNTYPNNQSLYPAVTSFWIAMGRTELSISFLKGLIDHQYEDFLETPMPNSAYLHYELARYLFTKNHLEEAFNRYHQAISYGIKNSKNNKKCSDSCLSMILLSQKLIKKKIDMEDSVFTTIIKHSTTMIYQDILKFLGELNEDVFIDTDSFLYQVLIGMLDKFSTKDLNKPSHFENLNVFYEVFSKRVEQPESLHLYQEIISSCRQKKVALTTDNAIKIIENPTQATEVLTLPSTVSEKFKNFDQVFENAQVYLLGRPLFPLIDHSTSPFPYHWHFMIFIDSATQETLLIDHGFWKSNKQEGLYTQKINLPWEHLIKAFCITLDPNQSIEAQLELNASLQNFTVDAIMVNSNGAVYDPFGGVQDLQNKMLRMIDSSIERVQKDPTLFLYAIKYRLDGFTWSERLEEVVSQWAEQVDHLSIQQQTHVQAVIKGHLLSLEANSQQAYIDLLIDYKLQDTLLSNETKAQLAKQFNLRMLPKAPNYPNFKFSLNVPDFPPPETPSQRPEPNIRYIPSFNQ